MAWASPCNPLISCTLYKEHKYLDLLHLSLCLLTSSACVLILHCIESFRFGDVQYLHSICGGNVFWQTSVSKQLTAPNCGDTRARFKPSAPHKLFVTFNLRSFYCAESSPFAVCSLYTFYQEFTEIPWHGRWKNIPSPRMHWNPEKSKFSLLNEVRHYIHGGTWNQNLYFFPCPSTCTCTGCFSITFPYICKLLSQLINMAVEQLK